MSAVLLIENVDIIVLVSMLADIACSNGSSIRICVHK
jgi:hypothetical protein